MLKIGIPGWSLGDNSFGATKPYLHFLSEYGEPHILPPSNDIFDHIDMIVLPGGKDTVSSRYGQPPSYHNSDPDAFKEHFFNHNLKTYIDRGLPVFGICLGFQMLNIYFGGSLTQNVYHPYSEKSRGEKVHTLNFTEQFKAVEKKLRYNPKEDKLLEVNSLHHQGFYKDQVSKEFDVVAYADDNLVEAFIHKTLPIAGVQYHPEEIWDGLSDFLFKKVAGIK